MLGAITSLVGGLIGPASKIIDDLHTSGEEKLAARQAMEKLIQQREAQVEETIRTELEAKQAIIVAELNQSDNYTKRARPSVIYAGLAFITWNYCIAPTAGMGSFPLPQEFWIGWSGIVATYSIGRSAEKRGTRDKLTGNPVGKVLFGP
jgi:hypothetical protein